MRKLLALAALTCLTGAALAQSNLTTRVFTYDATQATNGLSTYEVDDAAVTATGTAGTDTANSVTGGTVSAANFAVNTTIHVKTYVYISGNFGGTFTVHGAGSNTDSARNNDVEVRSNRPLTFTTSGFTTLRKSDLSSAATVGSVAYGLSIYTNFPAGSQVGTTQSGTDTAFNGKTLSFALSDLASNGKMTLRVARTLTLTQLAAGATDYNATGTVAVAVN
jgi:hypothetical protein